MSIDVAHIELLAFLDRDKICNCIASLARGEDRRSAEIISQGFWPDATTDFGIFSGNFAEYLAWVVPGSPAIPVTQHILAQTVIELAGNDASAETHVTSYHRVNMGDVERDIVMGGRYLDQLQKRGSEWRITHRVMLYDWVQDWGVSADWSQGLMGFPFSADHFTGKAVGDYSEQFFKPLAHF